MKSRSVFLLMICLILISSPLFTEKAESNVNIARLTQEAPGLHNYPGARGVVWYREAVYSLTADGKMQKESMWVILASKGIDEKWRNWEFSHGPGGSVEILESALYDPGTSSMLAPVIPETETREGLEITHVRFPELQDEYLIILSCREVIPKNCRLDDFLPIRLDLPIWENRISVSVPQGSELYYSSDGMDPPAVEARKDATKRYEWTTFNLDPADMTSLFADSRSFLCFSLRRGKRAFAMDIQPLSYVSFPETPARVSAFMQDANKIHGGSRIISYVEEAPLFKGLPEYYVRDTIPEAPPWTSFEKTLLLSKWLNDGGWNSEVYWLTEKELTDETPHTMGFITMPVLEVTPPGGSSAFYQLGQGYSSSELSPELWGRTVYSYEDGDLLKKILPRGKASDHRLNISWELELSEDGTSSGYLQLLVRNGWKAILLEKGKATDASVKEMISRLGISGYDPEGIKIGPIKYGSNIKVPVKFNSTIIGGNNLLLKFPAVKLDELIELAAVEPPYGLKFPFVLDVDFEITYPEGYGVLALPSTSDRDFGSIRLNEDISDNSRKRRITGSVKLVVDTHNIDNSVHRPLMESLRDWVQWMEKTIPLHKK